MLRKLIVIAVALVALMPFAPPATAGGWAAVVLETPLEEVVVSEDVTIVYRVLAHNRQEAPVPGMRVDFLFEHVKTGYFVAVSGEATADPEVYAITFTLDQAGEWEPRAMIRNFGDAPMLTRFPKLMASVETNTAGS